MEIQGTLKPPTTDTHKEATEQGPWAQLFGTFWAPQRGVPSSPALPQIQEKPIFSSSKAGQGRSILATTETGVQQADSHRKAGSQAGLLGWEVLRDLQVPQHLLCAGRCGSSRMCDISAGEVSSAPINGEETEAHYVTPRLPH